MQKEREIMKKQKKLNKYERKIERAEKLKKIFEGSGIYIFRNRTSGDYSLPKPALDGRKTIPKGETFKGDSFFLKMVPRELILVEIVEEQKQMEKLILDQPETVTTDGQIEHVKQDDEQKICESPNEEIENEEEEKEKDVLINEDPIDGVEILLD